MKPGYILTEAGIIPKDWAVQKLGRVAAITTGSKDVNEGNPAGEYPFFTCSRNRTFSDYYSFDTEAILIAGNGDVGNLHYYSGKFEAYQRTYVLYRFDSDVRYIWHQLTHRLVESLGLGKIGTSIPYIKKEDLTGFLFPIPPTEAEQRAIAEALSDVDELLISLDRLIAKKRDLKQASMQQLLSGKTRLPGFHGKWRRRRLGDVARIKTGSRNNQDKVPDGAYPFFVRSDVVEHIDSCSYDCEAILVPGEGRIGEIFHYIQGRFDVHQRVYAITQFSDDTSGKFTYFYMVSNFGTHALKHTVKATVDSLRLPTFQTFEMFVPATVEEQTAIAEVLTEIDEELVALEQRREKIRDLKQAIMQELLTGKTRLI